MSSIFHMKMLRREEVKKQAQSSRMESGGTRVQTQAGRLQGLCCGPRYCLSSYPNQFKFSFFIYKIEFIATLSTLQDCNEGQKMTWVTGDSRRVRRQKLKKGNYRRSFPSVRPLKFRPSSFIQCFPKWNCFLFLCSIALCDTSQSLTHLVFHCMHMSVPSLQFKFLKGKLS